MATLYQFLWGFAGSIAVFLVVTDESFSRSAALPRRYRIKGYLLNRFGIAVAAGLIAIAFDALSPIQAMYLGATTPLLIEAWSKKKLQSPRPDRCPPH